MAFENDEKYDNILLDIIQHVSNLPNFLDILFGFLRRRTDLFYTMTTDQQTMGFESGKAENLILNAFKKHKAIFESSVKSVSKVDNSINNHKKTPKNQIKSNVNSISQPEPTVENEFTYVADAESYNGAVRTNYTWSQTIGELDIRVKVPETVINSKQVKVIVEKKNLHVSYLHGDEPHYTDIINDDLCWAVKKNEVFWSFDRQENKILITVEKVQERWWEALFVGEDLINTRKIDCSRPMSDLDDEAQAKIHKLMYDNQQKRLGLPTSDEQNINETLRKAWNAEGSPFKGQEFDLSKIDMVGNN